MPNYQMDMWHAVDDMCVEHGIFLEKETDMAMALRKMVACEQNYALDPTISKDARRLQKQALVEARSDIVVDIQHAIRADDTFAHHYLTLALDSINRSIDALSD